MMDPNQITTEYVGKILEEKGVKPSFQRLSVLKYLMKSKNHPSVDKIFKALSQDIPTLSKTTVYNTLNLLTEKGIVTALNINDTEVLYDYIFKPHAHLLCTECGHVYDVFLDDSFSGIKEIDGHIISEAQINFKGVCKKCHN
ncbi:MAG: Fur family transcriptional regulator [Rhodothermaceae bacterium]